MNNYRAHRLGELIRDLISELMIRKIKDPRVALATITEVEMESNLRVARVYYSVQGDEQTRRNADKGLRSARGYMKRELSRALSIRFMPDLVFEFDSSLARAHRIRGLLNERSEEIRTGKDNG
ncbi:MAG: 30S ribosome-binding factor RbfA [Deltaproteobacteria bacterium]|nr:30S ribosome-binding factor RbfA [Deltaproteobacteria bacterium]